MRILKKASCKDAKALIKGIEIRNKTHIMNEATIRFVRDHREEDVRALALRGNRDKDVDLPWALDQIQGWQTARHKLPSWAAIDGIVYPPHLSMEQCSSEQTALYKCGIVNELPDKCRETLIDLTGGFGVDFAFMARHFSHAVYVERQEHLCETARHNFQLLELTHAIVVNDDAEKALPGIEIPHPESTMLYLDPARRDSNSTRTYAIADCTPNVLEMLPLLLERADHVLLKLSPMLDWHKAVNDLGERVAEVHIVSVGGECKELLILMSKGHAGEPTIHCVNDNQSLIYKPSQDGTAAQMGDVDSKAIAYLYEPNASVMKAGCFGVLTQRYPVKAVAADSHLFVSPDAIENFPGRGFSITGISTMNKKELNRALAGITRANIATRNFPMTAQQLRARLRLQDGGDIFIFGTTTATRQRVIFICGKL